MPTNPLPVLLAVSLVLGAQPKPLPRLKVSENARFLATADGKPFLYLADTAWELLHRLDRKQAIRDLDKRAGQGYNVIQAVALAELDGVTDPQSVWRSPAVEQGPSQTRRHAWLERRRPQGL